MDKVAFITGICGQDGSYLAELLLEKDYVVYGLIRRSSSINTKRIDHIYGHERLILRYGDLSDSPCLFNILAEIKRDHSFDRLEIYNLGAMSHVKVSFELPEYSGNVNGIGTLRLLEAIRQNDLIAKTRFYQASTSELYGKVVEVPQNENTPFYPRSPYAVSKLYAYWIVKNYREAYGMFASNGLLFNHESPRRGETFVTRKITRHLGDLKHGSDRVLELGNLNARRDWGHAKDYVYGMWLILQAESATDYVLATGEMHSVREFVEKAFALCGYPIEWRGEGINEEGYSGGRLMVRVNPGYFRPTEVEQLLGDPAKADRELGWRRICNFDQLVNDMVEADGGK